MKPTLPILSTCVLLSLQACMVASVQSNALSDTPGFGSQPVLPEPEQKLLPTIHIAKAGAVLVADDVGNIIWRVLAK